MMKDGNHITIAEQKELGCMGCPHLIIIPEQMIEFCNLPKNECSRGEDDIDCYGTDEIICPHCGYSFGVDSWEFFKDNSTTEIQIKCDECLKEFDCKPEYSVQYYSTTINKDDMALRIKQ